MTRADPLPQLTLAPPAPAAPAQPRGSGQALDLIEMPWHALGAAPLALALLRGRLKATHPHLQVRQHYLNLDWSEYLLKRTDGQITPRHYQEVADHGIAAGLGDWVFAGSLYGDPAWRTGEMLSFTQQYGIDAGVALRMRALADDFIEAAARDLASKKPWLAGFTTTFMQNLPSLALAKRLKEMYPQVTVIFGGANCDGPMGAALHRNHPFVDYVVRGEGEIVLPQLIDRISDGASAAGLDGVCWRDQDGASVANPQVQPAVPASVMAAASYEDWYARFTSSPAVEYMTPYLVMEGSRGCWWGQGHQCTFCGLNPATIGFRAKSPQAFWEELAGLVKQHGILDIVTSDNIMAISYFREVLPHMAAAGWDLKVHFEAKANVRPGQIAQFADAGVTMVQFGIESLSSPVLKLMRKGMEGPGCVRVLRDSMSAGLSVEWNWLYGFPGERPDHYRPVIDQIPALVHLEPPALGRPTRIELERFSPYFEQPDLGFRDRRPAAFYAHVYDLPPGELEEIAYYYDCKDQGIDGDIEQDLHDAVATWSRKFSNSHLHITAAEPGILVLTDEREAWDRRTIERCTIELTGWHAAAYQALSRPRSPRSLHAHLAESSADSRYRPPDADGLARWLAGLREQRLVFTDSGKWVALATSRAHQKMPR